MKLILTTLSIAFFLTGCSQPKNRLADEKNAEFQKRNASKTATGNNKKSEVVDIPTLPAQAPVEVAPAKPVSAEPAITIPVPSRNEAEEGAVATVTAPKTTRPAPAANPLASSPAAKTPPAATGAAAAPAAAPAATTPAATAAAPAATATAPGAQAAPAAAAPAPQAAAADAATAAAQAGAPHELNFDELVGILTALAGNFEKPEQINVILGGFISAEENPNVDTKKLMPVAMFNADGISAAILHDGKPLTMIQKAKITTDGKLLQANATEGYKFHGACALENCDILFVGFYKFTGENVTTNLPCFFKKVGDKYVIAVRKPKAYYEEEAKKRAAAAK